MLGLRWDARRARRCAQRLGIQLQETQLAEKLTVEETLRAVPQLLRRAARRSTTLIGARRSSTRSATRASASCRAGRSSGWRVACALVGDPELLFLDEPTTGLDPQSRRQLWDLHRASSGASGGTILLTTHYMDEAERLCDRVAIVDHGKVIALGTPRELIASLGAEHVVEFALAEAARRARATRRCGALPACARSRARRRPACSLVQRRELHAAVPALLDALRAAPAPARELTTHSATLEDVFVSLTGRHLRDE